MTDETPEPEIETPETRWSDDRAKCADCDITKDRVIRRLNLSTQTKPICDECFDERTKTR